MIEFIDKPMDLTFEEELADRVILYNDDYLVFYSKPLRGVYRLYTPGLCDLFEATQKILPFAAVLNSTVDKVDSSIISTLLANATVEDIIKLREAGLI